MGFNTFVLLLTPILITITVAFKIAAIKFGKLQLISDKLSEYFLLSFPLRLFLESYLNILLSSMINLHYLQFSRYSYGETLSGSLSIFFVILCLVSPVLMFFYIRKRNGRSFHKWFIGLESDINPNKKS